MHLSFLPRLRTYGWILLLGFSASATFAQNLINIDFGVGERSARTGFAATGQHSNDVWNLYSHYKPRFSAGMPPVLHGRLENLLFADGTKSTVSLTLSNAPGVWGNSSGDPMWDTYLYAADGSNMVATVAGLPGGQYHVYLYGRAEADVAGQQDSVFSLTTGTNLWGPLVANGGHAWRVGEPMVGGVHYVLFRDVKVDSGDTLKITVAPGTHGVAVLNGLQILSRGSSAPRRPIESVLSVGQTSPLVFREVRYEGVVTGNEARFQVFMRAEAPGPGPASGLLFEGDLAILSPELPENWRVSRQGTATRLVTDSPGEATVRLVLVPRIQRHETWNHVAFKGPSSPISTLAVSSEVPDTDIQVLEGTPSTPEKGGVVAAALGAKPEVGLRWQSRSAEVVRPSHVTVDNQTLVKLTPAGLQQVTTLHYEVLQGTLSSTRIRLSPGHSLTRLDGDPVRDWRITQERDGSVLTVDFIQPIDKTVDLILTTDQASEGAKDARLIPAQPLDIQRESGGIAVRAEDVVVRVESLENLRQINARKDEVAAFRFFSRPASARVVMEPLQPELAADDQIAVRLEETRMVVTHRMKIEVTQAGIYSLDLVPPANSLITGVRADGLERWKMAGERLHLALTQRALGRLAAEVDVEQALSPLPPVLDLRPIRVVGAVRATARIGVTSAPGLRLKTETVTGAREVPASTDQGESLAYRAEDAVWDVKVGLEPLPSRVVAEAFHLMTIGDGLVGGSATLRYGILNQGIQQLRLRIPTHWRNVEFTGPGIRRKDQQGDLWTLSLQEKVWDGYTLVLTYDHEFDPKGANLNAAGAQALDVERQTGFVAVTTAAALKLEPLPAGDSLRAIDPVELPEADRKLITRPVLLAYRYAGPSFDLKIRLTRHEEFTVLDAVADRTQLTTVLTEAGEMLTQASFMVKNNDRQFQKFQLPRGATLWGVYVNGEPVKAESDGDWLLVSLPRVANRDQSFAVDLKYAQQLGPLGRFFPQRLELVAPGTDVPSTYGEWELFIPAGRRLSGFGGSMTPLQGTTYGLRDAWTEFVAIYRGLWLQYGARLIVASSFIGFVLAVFLSARRYGFRGITQVLVVFTLIAILASMLLPALSKAKAKSTRIKSVNNLKQIGVAARVWATDNGDGLPPTLEALSKELGSPAILINPENGQPYIYLGANKKESDPNGILAYGQNPDGSYTVVMVDGSVQMLTGPKFQDALTRSEQSAAVSSGPISPELASRYRLPSTPTPGAPAVAAALIPGPHGSGAVATTAPGLRSIRIEVPRSGKPFHFAKVLNLQSEPLRIHARLMKQRVWTGARMAFEVTAFLAGLILIGWSWTRPEPMAWRLAVGGVLVLASATSLFLAWRILHLVLIWGLPVAAFLAAGNAVSLWKRNRNVRRHSRSKPPSDAGTPPPIHPVTPVAAILVAGAFFSLGTPESTAAMASQTRSAASAPAITLISGSYAGVVSAGVARFDATFELMAYATNQSLPLFTGNVAVESFHSATRGAQLWHDGTWLGVEVPEPGPVTLNLILLVKLDGDVTRRQLTFAVPAALANQIDLLVDEPDAEIEFPSAVTFKRAVDGTNTRVQGLLGSGNQVTLAWSPRIKRAAEVAATVFVQQASLITIGSGVAHVRSTLQFQIAQGEMRQANLLLPAGHRLLRVQCAGLRTWDFVTNNPLELSLELARAATGTLALVVETEKVLGSIPTTLALEVPQALNVRRENGVVAVRPGDDVLLTLERTEGLQRVDAAEFAHLTKDAPTDLMGTYRFLRPDFKLTARVELIEPEVEAIVRQAFTVGTEQLNLSASMDFEVRRLGAFNLAILLPKGWRLENVNCPAMERWADRRTGEESVLEIALKQRTLGKIPVRVDLVQTSPGLRPRVELSGVHPLGVLKVTGSIEAAGEPGVGLKTGTTQGLVEIPVSALGEASQKAESPSPSLAFKYLAATPGPRPSWQLALDTERVESWVRAEVAHVVTLTETLVSGRTLVRFEIQNAPSRAFSIRVPVGWRNVELLGEGIRRRDVTNGLWTVELQSKVRGSYFLTVLWEQDRDANPAPWQLTGFAVDKVERETGYVTLLARPPLQVSPGATVGDLARIDIQELPDWTGVAAGHRSSSGPHRSESAVLAWRYLRPGYSLAVDVQRYSDASVLQALVEQARLTTVVADDGQSMTQMRLTVRNNGRQLIEVQLPGPSTVWSATIAGQPVRPRQYEGRLFLPLDGTGDPEAPIAIELTYVGIHRFPATRGRVELASPQLDIPLKDARWDVYLPPDYDYTDFAGTMNHELTDLAPLAQDFTLAEYRRQEEASEEAELAELKRVVERARTQLSRGLLGLAENELGSIRSGKLKKSESSPEVQQLKEELNRQQSSNFLQAQNEFVFSNSGRQAGQTPPDAAVAQHYTVEAAGRQAAVVQKAQSVTVSRVQPLRVNLPTRGIRHSFTQVLQTEVRRPMTIRFEASNTRRTGWLKPLVLGALGFVALWAVAGAAILFRLQRPATQISPTS